MTEKKLLGRFEFKVSGDNEIGFLKLPNRPTGKIKVHRNIILSTILPDLKGPDIVLDLDDTGEVIGIEIITYRDDYGS